MENRNTNVLHDMGGWSQFFFLWFLFFSGLMLASVAVLLLMSPERMMNSAASMRMAMAIQTICLFVVPALAFTYLCQSKPKEYLKVENKFQLPLLFFAIVFIIAVQPIIFTLSYYNQQLSLPDSLAPLEEWMKNSEASASASLNLLFEDHTIFGLIFNLLVLAVVAGLGEELFFRGCIQQIMQKIFKNTHAAVWIGAVIFSAMHFQFYGFFPRVLLGAFLGYIFVWSANIWIPVIIHTMHNAINIILTYILYKTPEYDQMEAFSFDSNTILIISSLVVSVLSLFLIYRNKIARNLKTK